jgi:hypothetical protein
MFMKSKHLFCLQIEAQYKVGQLSINDKGLYTVGDHVLSESEIVSIFHKGQYIETSIHYASQVLYSAIGLPIELGQMIKYEAD